MITYQLQQLRERLDQIKPFYVKTKSMPVLNCIRVSPRIIEYSNLDVTFSAPMNGSGEGIFMVPFQTLYEYVKSSEMPEIIFDETNGQVMFGDSSTRFVMQDYYSPDDFPTIPVNDFNVAGAATPQQVQHAFSCSYAADKDDIRFNLNGVCVDAPNKTVVATNGHRLALRKMEFTLNSKDKHIIPRFVASGLLEIIKGKSEVVQFSPSEIDRRWIAIRTGDVSLYIKGYDQYPNYEAVLPREGALKLSFFDVKSAVKQLREIKKVSPKLRVFALKGSDSETVYAATASYRGVMQGCKAYQECFFLVNINYLLDCLKQYEKAGTLVYVRNNKDKASPWVFSSQNSSDIDLIMPLRGDKEELWFKDTEDVKQQEGQ